MPKKVEDTCKCKANSTFNMPFKNSLDIRDIPFVINLQSKK
jgi:hypothetical protein